MHFSGGQTFICVGQMFTLCHFFVTIEHTNDDADDMCVQRDLASKQAHQVVSSILLELVEGIRSPDRPSSPIDAYITETELFSRQNPLVGVVRELHL